MNLIATRAFRHLGKRLKAGDPFSAHPVIGRAYTRTGYASESMEAESVEVEVELQGADQTYETRVMVADVPIKRGRGRPRKVDLT